MYIILFFSFIVVSWIWMRRVKSLPEEERRSFLWKSGFIAVLLTTILLAATGRLHWLGAAITAVVPIFTFLFRWARRVLPLMRIFGGLKPRPSKFKTKTLTMDINFSTMEMNGYVIDGEYSGKSLSELTAQQLSDLSAYCKNNDKESYALLYGYMAVNGKTSDHAEENMSSANMNDLSEDEAYAILGLEKPSSKSEISKAHISLIQKLHADRGGSDYLAAKINAAKDKIS